ncbi:hypothetical protein HDC37_003411 [Microbacterium sp. AK009]|uniref:hypothetical protein n=1 Tax=Microbacterium sp. AK009 TaxID=2723068 RepID=UPI0015CCDDB3|nr:hypothetical protein [Microbacterium sp. AK009]NYF18546.1 hypothetical protein [Microbacterium sp. AK009]
MVFSSVLSTAGRQPAGALDRLGLVETIPGTSWWDRFVSELLGPAAAAELVITTFGTALALVGAVVLFRRQLRHDRELLREQLTADRRSRIADVRAAAARSLGQSLFESTSAFDAMDDPALHAALSVRGSYSTMKEAVPDADVVYDAHGRAVRELDLDDSVLDLWRMRNKWWEAVRSLISDPRIASLPLKDQQAILFATVDAQFSPLRGLTKSLGRRLLRWDGEGDPPTLTPEERQNTPLLTASRAEVRVMAEAEFVKQLQPVTRD